MSIATRMRLTLLLSLFSLVAGNVVCAQTQTPRYVSMASATKAYYEYLPQGYDPNGTATYPLILFMTGIGEFGDGSASQLPKVLTWGVPKLINDGVFPTSFTAGGQIHKFIVISPQWLSSPRPTPQDMDAVLNYIVAHYKVNTNRIYITGLSYGGGLCFAYAGNSAAYASRVAAIVPTASPLPDGGYTTIYNRSRVIAGGNVAVWATHNSGDTPDSAARTIAYVNDINMSPAPTPAAKATIFPVSGHNSWNATYDINFRENGYNIYEWMLLKQKGVNAAPVAKAGADKTITLPSTLTITGSGTDSDGSIVAYNWTQKSGPNTATISSPDAAKTTFSGMVAGIYYFRLTVTDNNGATGSDLVKVTVNAATTVSTLGTVQVNIYGGSNSYSNTAWNNWNIGTSSKTNITSLAFKYTDGTTSPISAILSASSGVGDNGSTYGSGGTIPAPVLRYYSTYSALRTLTLRGLSTSKTYVLELYGSRNSSSAGSTVYTVNGRSVTVNVVGNTSTVASFSNVTPTSDGQLLVTINKTATNDYVNGFKISEVALKSVKANIYGGANPYSSTDWNNWNVGTAAATNVTSPAFKYAGGAASTITSVLSATTSILDNGSTYGGGMAPAEVLRYCSKSSALRTLTISGLSASKTYDVQLYSSRNYSSAGNTIFSIGSSTISINASGNRTNAATFTGVAPNSSGQIVVSINKSSSYSYFNGFVITEAGGSASALASAPATTNKMALSGVSPVAEATQLQAYPNPGHSQLTLNLQSAFKGAVYIQFTDAGGKLCKQVRVIKNTGLLQQQLFIAELAPGAYYITVLQGAARQTTMFRKE